MSDLEQDYDDDDVNLIEDAYIEAPGDAATGDASGEEGELAPTAVSVLDLLVTSLVDDPDAVRIDPIEQRGKVRLEVRVGPDDMGRVIGKRGRVANAIRTVVRAAAVRDGVDVDIEFED
jgi:predicted RNA-binding protein YlqC (UPF0109 family)